MARGRLKASKGKAFQETVRCGRPMTLGHITVLGAGNMGTALVRGLLKSGAGSSRTITATHPKQARLRELARDLKVDWSKDNKAAAAKADVLILAVKPQILDEVLDEVRDAVPPTALVLSIAAGVTTGHIEAALGGTRPVVRAMPNVAAIVGLSATALCAGRHTTKKHVATAHRVFESVGIVVDVPEYLMDAVTGLSGTGPMYVFQILEGLSDAGVRVGLSRHVATQLVQQTLLGSARMAQELGQHPAMLKDLVTSPGGTAIAALHSLERNGLRAVLMDAVEAATVRSKELGRAKAQRTTAPAGDAPQG
jgi:pyrroline-5-carboxylate reductase